MIARFRQSRSVAIVGLIGVSALTAGIVQAASSNSPSASAQAPTASPVSTTIGTYTVFARTATAADDVSKWRIPPGAEQQLGLKLAQARVVYADATRTVAAIPATKGPCFFQRFSDGAGGINCGGPDRPTIVLGYDGALGLMPDSVKTVAVTMADGTTQTDPVVNNLWHSPVEAAKATFTVGTVTQSLELMPRSRLPKGATIHANGFVTGGNLPGTP